MSACLVTYPPGNDKGQPFSSFLLRVIPQRRAANRLSLVNFFYLFFISIALHKNKYKSASSVESEAHRPHFHGKRQHTISHQIAMYTLRAEGGYSQNFGSFYTLYSSSSHSFIAPCSQIREGKKSQKGTTALRTRTR